jgi:hypothetical protein
VIELAALFSKLVYSACLFRNGVVNYMYVNIVLCKYFFYSS